MAELETIARPYAEAVFAQAQMEGQVASWQNALMFLQIIAKNQDVALLSDSPAFTKDELTGLILDVAGVGLSATQQNFLKLLVENGRIKCSPLIKQQFDQLVAKTENSMEVEVTAAFALSDNDSAKLEADLAQKFGKKIKLASKVDESLLGGVVIKAGDMVIDSSVRGQIEQLASSLGVSKL